MWNVSIWVFYGFTAAAAVTASDSKGKQEEPLMGSLNSSQAQEGAAVKVRA